MIFFMVFLILEVTDGKTYERCELARELKFVHKAPSHQLATWVCIAEHESQYNTSIVGHLNGDGSGDHGIFQISDQYWCSPPGKGFVCGLTCAELEDDDISDDFICAQIIYKEHKQISGDGFNAWAVYQPHCKGSKAERYIKNCFNDSEHPKTFTNPKSSFAHGFFDTVAGRTQKEFTQKSAFEPFLNFRSPSVTQSAKYPPTIEEPMVNSFSAPISPFYIYRFLTSTESPKSDLFFTPTATAKFKPTTRASTSFLPTSRATTKNVINFNPTPRVQATPTVSQSPIFEFKKTFTLSSNRIIFNPTVSTSAYKTSTSTYPPPIFIVNGVKWY